MSERNSVFDQYGGSDGHIYAAGRACRFCGANHYYRAVERIPPFAPWQMKYLGPDFDNDTPRYSYKCIGCGRTMISSAKFLVEVD